VSDAALQELARQQRIANIIALTRSNFVPLETRRALANEAIGELDL
jgi:hypothetical protein